MLCGVRGGEVREGRLMDRRTSPNQFAPSTSSKLGHNNALMYKLCKSCPDKLIFFFFFGGGGWAG